ncbi:MAG: hypothetical protein NZ849_09405 [Meiothermus sp.]|uniref:hypothetical protein n=1 Tax=Meiothermus sp. TaxID=1955249 RepID=UPI0025D13AE8|nr:hypothetical protein [Meiothermus sp.]MCS7058507.1 hypothetical protein [Meiothermus sp.]MCS7195106.1 hypothetical protein [Meiothermus sp.]MCX7740258.1 hypothetical protein [Meiothermus sp.]MDW8091038.1 hypothetical protein [Meiothermus sp.]MDW8480927.1 hypothetical protein [Meiothermus sp.]
MRALLPLLLGWALAQGPPALTPEGVFSLASPYLGQATLREAYKFSYGLKPKERLVVYELRVPGVEVWVEAGTRRVVLLRPKGVPKHLAEPHLPFPQVLALVRSRYGEPWHLELKPKPKEQLLVWEAKGAFGEVWLEARTGREVLRR